MILEIGKAYKKSDFGIEGSEKQWSEITVKGMLFTFFSEHSNYKNSVEEDGFIYEGRGEYALIPFETSVNLNRHVFYKEAQGSYWIYLGVGSYEKRYDDKRNKIFFE